MMQQKVTLILAAVGALSGLLSATTAWALEPISGYEFLTPETQAMQYDEVENPAMMIVDKGRALYDVPGDNGNTCATCHGENGSELNTRHMATYPVYNEEYRDAVTLQKQIHICWEDYMDNFPQPYNHSDAVALESYVKYLARGETVDVDIGGPLKPYYEEGEKLYNTRFGQMNIACIHCHDYHQGKMLRGQKLTQGQSNGFPEYRLATGKVTTLHGRLKECFYSFRGEPFDAGSQEFINLEVYLNARGNGLKIETPAIRY